MYNEEYAQRLKCFHERPHGQAIYDAVLDSIQYHAYRGEQLDMLEFGCGTGILSAKLLQSIAFLSVIGTDPNIALFGKENMAQGPGYSITRPQHDFDVVLCSNVIGHLENSRPAFVYFRECLKVRNGVLVMTIPSYSYWWVMRPLNKLRGYKSDPTLRYMWQAHELVHELSLFGFRLIEKRSVSPVLGGLFHESHVLTFVLEK